MRHSILREKKVIQSFIFIPRRPEGHDSSCVIIFLDVYLSEEPRHISPPSEDVREELWYVIGRESASKYVRRTTRRERERKIKRIDGRLSLRGIW